MISQHSSVYTFNNLSHFALLYMFFCLLSFVRLYFSSSSSIVFTKEKQFKFYSFSVSLFSKWLACCFHNEENKKIYIIRYIYISSRKEKFCYIVLLHSNSIYLDEIRRNSIR